MLKSLAARIVFTPKDMSDARETSEELGNTTMKVRSYSRSQMGFGEGKRTHNVNISEQRRALLLPQEVKALGSEHALIFYEGLLPIQCQKIRYFQEPRFTVRILPPPAVAKAEPAPMGTASPKAPSSGAQAEDGEQQKEEVRVRDATVEDIDRIDDLQLGDFAAPYEEIEVPQAERLSNEQIAALSGAFLACNLRS
jgi:type IV secretion system protein VirD4